MGQTRFVKLRYTLPALADLNLVLDYIAAHSPHGARRVQAGDRLSRGEEQSDADQGRDADRTELDQ